MTDKIISLNDEFDKNIKLLLTIWVNKNKNDNTAHANATRNKRRIIMVMNNNPTYIMKTLGPYFLKYGDYIKNNKLNELFKIDFEKEYADELKDSDSRDMITETMTLVKKIYNTSTDVEKKMLLDVMKDALSSYVKYVLHLKSS